MIALIAVIFVNILAASTTLIGGKVTAQISDENPTLITPAGYVFSIWSVIYILLAFFVISQLLPLGREVREKVGWLFIISSILNIVWLFLWQYELLLLSVGVMFLLLITLILIYLRLGVGKSVVRLREKLLFHLPFSVYLGWITIASIANVAAAAVSINWDGFGISPEIWAITVLVTALLIAILVIITRKDITYGLVIIWAIIGIAVKQSSSPNIVITIEIIIAILALTMIATILFPRLRYQGGNP